MNEKIISWKINASDEYATFNLITFLSMFYSAGVPVLVPLAFVNLFSKYISNRSLMQSVSSRVDGLSEQFNSPPFSLIPVLLLFSNLIGDWMLTANTYIGAFNYMTLAIPQINFLIFNRLLIFPFYPILALVVIL
jgi:hypothetical protein